MATDSESLVSVEWQIKHKNFSVLLVAIYRPPYSEAHAVTVKTLLQEFRSYDEGVCATAKHMLITGDFNRQMNIKDDT